MTPDYVTCAFTFGGAALTFTNMRRVVKDKGYAGVYPPSVAFFTAWGFWNLYFYPAVGLWWSFFGGLSMVTANAAWITAMLWYGRKPTR